MSNFLQLPNGTILANDWTQIQPAVARVYQTINVDALIASIQRRRADWLSDGDDLTTVQIPVADMFEEFADLLVELGLADAYQRLGIIEPRYEVIDG